MCNGLGGRAACLESAMEPNEVGLKVYVAYNHGDKRAMRSVLVFAQ